MPGVGPGVPIVRMDADTTSGKGAHQRLLEEFAAADAAVLLGTQMIAKGLDFEDVTLVGVINADTMLKLPDYRASERTFDLVEQVAGRAGRAELPGRVLVQTYEADAAPIRAAAAYDRALFLRAELPKRRMLRYPPYVRMANVLVWGKDEEAVRTSAAALYEGLAAQVRDFGGEGWDCLLYTSQVQTRQRPRALAALVELLQHLRVAQAALAAGDVAHLAHEVRKRAASVDPRRVRQVAHQVFLLGDDVGEAHGAPAPRLARLHGMGVQELAHLAGACAVGAVGQVGRYRHVDALGQHERPELGRQARQAGQHHDVRRRLQAGEHVLLAGKHHALAAQGLSLIHI